MPKFIMLVGLPAVGKDYWANKYKEKHPEVVIYNSDDIREELYGDARTQYDHASVFSIMRSRSMKSLSEGYDVIYNATNIAYKDRKGVLSQIKQIKEVECICKIFVAPVEVCKERNSARERSVPDYVYDKMLRRWQTPCEWEGFDSIEVILTSCWESPSKYFGEMRGFNQKNHHHKYDLYTHCSKSVSYLFKMNLNEDPLSTSLLADSLQIHDIGKLFTQSLQDQDGNCHYYNHENVGAYLALTCAYSIFGSQMITWHMLPYTKDKNTLEAWKKRMGEDFWHWLTIFHECDMKGH